MTITRLELVSLWDRPPNVPGAVCYGYLDQVASWEYTRRRDAAHVATITAPITGNAAQLAVQRRVLALHFAPPTPGGLGAVHALRISETARTQSAEGLEFRVVARSLLFDWADAGPLSAVLSGGKQEFAVTGDLLAQDWGTTFLIPHLARQGYDYFALFCSSTLRIPHAAARQSALEVLNALQAYLGFEVEVTPAGGQVLVNLVPQVNAALAPLRIAVGRNARRVAQTKASIEQATVLVPFGGAGHSEASQSVQSLVFDSTNVNLPAKELEPFPFSDSAWSFPVIAQDNQFVDPSGQRTWYLQRLKTGRCFPIVQAWAGGTPSGGVSGRVRLADLTDVPNGYLWQLREGRTPGTEIDVPVPGTPLRVSGAPAGAVVTLVDPFTGGDPVPTDDVHVDCRARRSTLVLSTTSSSVAAVAGSATDVDVTVATTSGVQVGDWGFAHNNAGTPWGLFGKVCTVVQIVSATVLRVRVRYTFDTGVPFSAGAMVKSFSVYRVVSGFRAYVNDESAAANTITLDTATGLAANDLLEYTLDNSGAALTGIPSPLVGTYGIARKSKDFPTARCAPNLAQAANPVFDVYLTAAGQPPDLWTGTGDGVFTKLTTNLPGPGTNFAVQLAPISTTKSLISSPIYVRPTAGDSVISVRARVRTLGAFYWDGAASMEISLAVRATNGATLATMSIVPPNYSGPRVGATEVATDTVVDLDLLAVDLLHTPGAGQPYAPWVGVQVVVSSVRVGGPTGVARFDCGGIYVTQDATLPPSPYMGRFGHTDLFGLGQLALQTLDDPETANEIDAFDLQRALGEAYGSEELVEGRTVRVEAEALGLDFEDRIDAVTYRGQPDDGTEVRVATRTTRFADVLANYLTSGT